MKCYMTVIALNSTRQSRRSVRSRDTRNLHAHLNTLDCCKYFVRGAKLSYPSIAVSKSVMPMSKTIYRLAMASFRLLFPEYTRYVGPLSPSDELAVILALGLFFLVDRSLSEEDIVESGTVKQPVEHDERQ